VVIIFCNPHQGCGRTSSSNPREKTKLTVLFLIAEWLDPSNLEDQDNTTQALLNELAEESDQVAAEVEFWPVSVDAGNVRNNNSVLVSPILPT